MSIRKNKAFFILQMILFIYLFLENFVSAGIINYKEPLETRWKKDRAAKEAYRPYPIVFSHGFGSGGPRATWVEREKQKESEKPKLDEKLRPYFANYYNEDPITKKSIIALKDTTRLPYLELVSYIDFSRNARSQLIDRNSSIDTYQEGDYYVQISKKMEAGKDEKRVAGDHGWADKLNTAIEKIRENYTDRNGYPLKINLMCHSMGGLSVREYLTNQKYANAPDKVSKVIMTGVPNLDAPWASLEVCLTRTQKIGWFVPGVGWLASSIITGLDRMVFEKKQMDINGDAARDMDVGKGGSGFLAALNRRDQPQGVDYYVIWGNSHSLDTLLGRQLHRGEGDGVVSKDSQLGTKVLHLKGAVEINASHGTEPREIGKLELLEIGEADNAKPLLRFIDSAKPELEITSPDPEKITEINENMIRIKGEVSKEYLPADSILKIEVIRQEDGSSESPIEGKLLYPSDLWVVSDSDSVVAEFDEPINFSQSGTYTVSCSVKNPAGISSDIKQVQVKVVSENPLITNVMPVGLIDDTTPLIYAKIFSPSGKKINLGSITISLDNQSILPVTVVSKDGSEVEVYYTLTSELSRTAHQVYLSGSDETGKSVSKTWDFVIAPLSEITYVGSGQLVSASRKPGNCAAIRSFSREEFSQKLLEVRGLAAADGEYHDANKNNLGISIIWQGSSKGDGLVECCLFTAQRLNFKMDVCKGYVPLYIVVSISPKYSAVYEGQWAWFIKSVQLEINGQRFALSEAYQKAIYYGGRSAGQGCVRFIIPYSEDVSVAYSFDPYIYTLDEPISSSPEAFILWAGTRLDISVYAMGLPLAKK